MKKKSCQTNGHERYKWTEEWDSHNMFIDLIVSHAHIMISHVIVLTVHELIVNIMWNAFFCPSVSLCVCVFLCFYFIISPVWLMGGMVKHVDINGVER